MLLCKTPFLYLYFSKHREKPQPVHRKNNTSVEADCSILMSTGCSTTANSSRKCRPQP